MKNVEQMSLLEVAIELMEQKGGICDIKELIKEVLEAKGLDSSDPSFTSQLYVDITTSSNFVYMGEDNWDLKSRQSLEEFNKDGSAFNSKDDYVEDEEDADLSDEDLDEESLDEDDEDEDEDDDRNSMYVPDDDYDEDEDNDSDEEDDEDDLDDSEELERYTEEDDDFNEDKYNDYMDDYEDMYDKD